MATTPVEFRAPTGLTLTLELYAYGSDTIGNTGGDSATEATNRKGLYSANVTEALAGWYTAHVKSGSTVIAVYDVFMVDDTNVHRCTDRPQDQAQETVAAVTATVSADMVAISGDATAADNLEAACDGAGYNIGGGAVVAASVTGAVGSVTGAVGSVTGNVGGISGTITSLDALNTAIRGADSDTLKTLSDQIDGVSAGSSPQLLQNTTIATLATQTSFTLTAGSADDDAYNGAVAILTDQATATQKAFVAITDYVGSTKTITLAAAPAFTIATGDTIDIVAAASDAPTAAAIRAEIDSNSTQLAAILLDTGTTLPATLTTIEGKIDTVDSTVDAILIDTAEIGAAGAGLTSIPWNASWDAEVQSECTDALNAYDPPTNTEMTAEFTAIKGATWSAVTDTLEAIRDRTYTAAEVRAEIDSNSTQLAAIVADTNELQTDWANGGRLDLLVDAILEDTGTTLPATLTTIEGKVDAVDTVVDTILIDTAELQTDWTNGGRLDLLLDAVLLDTGTTLPAQITGLNNISAADVNAQVLDVINTDTLVAGQTLAEAVRRIGAITSGTISGAGTGTETFVDWAGSGSTIVITVDASGNRSGVTYN